MKRKQITTIKSLFHFGDVFVNNNSSVSLSKYLCSVSEKPQKSIGLTSQLMYDTCPADFIGRDNEINLLYDFANDNRTLLWWSITGSAGKGKTRLAHEFVKQINQNRNWIARFINWRTFVDFFTKNNLIINEKKNILIVIDYIFSYEKEIAKWVEWISQKSNINMKLRILLIEREDQKLDASGRTKFAPWEEMFSSVPDDLMLMRRLKFEPKNINLNISPISTESAFKIVESYCKKRDIQITQGKINSIIVTAQKSSNNIISPLQLLLLTEYYANSHNGIFSTDTYQLALESMVIKEVGALRRIFNITEKEKEIFELILLLATIIGKIDMESYLLKTQIFKDKLLLKKLLI